MLEELKAWTLWVGKWVFVVIMATWLAGQTPLGRDDSDSGSWGGGRSGLKLRTDDLTGCQYLETADGGITPRLDAAGRQLGCRAR